MFESHTQLLGTDKGANDDLLFLSCSLW